MKIIKCKFLRLADEIKRRKNILRLAHENKRNKRLTDERKNDDKKMRFLRSNSVSIRDPRSRYKKAISNIFIPSTCG